MVLPINIGMDVFGSNVAVMNGSGIDGSGGGALAIIDLTDPTTSADFVGVFNDNLDEYEISFVNIQPNTDDDFLYLRASTDGGASFLAGTNYTRSQYMLENGGVAIVTSASAADSIIWLSNNSSTTGVGNGATEGINGSLWISKMSDTSHYKTVRGWSIYASPSGTAVVVQFGGTIKTASALNALRFGWNSGTFKGGKIKLKGKKSTV